MSPARFSVEPNQRFGRLVVQEELLKRDLQGPPRWAARCLCDCGTEVIVLLQNLKFRTRSCGCMKRRGTMSTAFAESRGQRPRLNTVRPQERFGRLVVLREMRRDGSGWAAECECDCGEKTTVLVNNLLSGSSRSCGCLQRQRASESNRERTTHALSDHEHYPRWRNMLHRCENPEDSHYSLYGGRGISVCPEWHDVAVFVAYLDSVLGPRPKGYTFDRIDNEGNYEPGNVRWASPVTQRNNQRRAMQ